MKGRVISPFIPFPHNWEALVKALRNFSGQLLSCSASSDTLSTRESRERERERERVQSREKRERESTE